MYSNPTFDPNALAVHDTQAVQNAFNCHQQPATSRRCRAPYRDRYSPGSTFKMVTSKAAHRRRHRDAERPGLPRVGRLPDPRDQHEARATSATRSAAARSTESLIISCNATFAALGYQLGNEFAPAMDNCGIDSARRRSTSHRAQSRASGRAPARTSARFALAGIGQGDVFTSPLEMALIAAGIANGGVIMEPHVVQEIPNSDGKVVRTIDPEPWKTCMSPTTAQTLTNMMVQVVNQGTGTAAQIDGVDGRRQDRYRADRRRGRGAARVVRRVRAGQRAAVRGVGDRRARRELRQRGDRWRGRGADRQAGAPDDLAARRTRRRSLP